MYVDVEFVLTVGNVCWCQDFFLFFSLSNLCLFFLTYLISYYNFYI